MNLKLGQKNVREIPKIRECFYNYSSRLIYPYTYLYQKYIFEMLKSLMVRSTASLASSQGFEYGLAEFSEFMCEFNWIKKYPELFGERNDCEETVRVSIYKAWWC